VQTLEQRKGRKMKLLIEIDENVNKAVNEFFEGKRQYVGVDNGIKLLEAVRNGTQFSESIGVKKEEL
jgi:hypothetical protein